MGSDAPGGPSEAALWHGVTRAHMGAGYESDMGRAAITAAHDPALGTNRSVNLGAVTTWLWTSAPGMAAWQREQIADAVAREFGGGPGNGK